MPTFRDLPLCDGCDQPAADATPDDNGVKMCTICRLEKRHRLGAEYRIRHRHYSSAGWPFRGRGR